MTTTTTHEGDERLQARWRLFKQIDAILDTIDAGDVAAEAALATPRSHSIDTVDFELYPTGALALVRPGQPLVELSAQDAHALLTFLRMPGVAELIEQVEAARQAQNWRDFEETQKRERAAGR